MMGFLDKESYTISEALTYCVFMWQGLLLIYHIHPIYKGQEEKLTVSIRNIFYSASGMEFLSKEPSCCPAFCPILLCYFSWYCHTQGLSLQGCAFFFFPFTCLQFSSLPALVIIPGYHCHFLEPLPRTGPQNTSV